MKIAMVGLGKMGGNMARRLHRGGHMVVGYNNTPEVYADLQREAGLVAAASLEEAIVNLEAGPKLHRVVWLMLPAGDATESTIQLLMLFLSPGDIVIDGGNSNFKDSIRRAEMLGENEINFLDVGVSGGIWGLKEGYSMMIGGSAEIVDYLRPIFETLAPAPDRGWGRVGPNGAGHYVKMLHNGIEYGLMESYAEGYEMLRARPDLVEDLRQVTDIWRHGSVIRSWLLDLVAAAIAEDPDLTDIIGWVADSGEGRWTVIEAIENAVPLPVITAALFRRFSSRQKEQYAAKLLAAMRNQFGGHAVVTREE